MKPSICRNIGINVARSISFCCITLGSLNCGSADSHVSRSHAVVTAIFIWGLKILSSPALPRAVTVWAQVSDDKWGRAASQQIGSASRVSR